MLSVEKSETNWCLQVRELANKTGMDFSQQIKELEDKYDQVFDLLWLPKPNWDRIISIFFVRSGPGYKESLLTQVPHSIRKFSWRWFIDVLAGYNTPPI